MLDGNTNILRPRCASVFRAVTHAAILAAMIGMFWYGSLPRTPDAPTPYWNSPIAAAAREGDMGKFVKAVDALDSIDRPDSEGVTPLLFIARSGDEAAAEYLLIHGANPNYCNADYGTPLIVAITSGNYGVATLLLRHGADATQPTLMGDTPLAAAVRSDRWDLAEEIAGRKLEQLAATNLSE